jgi:hypothetical protein
MERQMKTSKTQQMKDHQPAEPMTASKLAVLMGWFRTARSGKKYPNSKTARRIAGKLGVPLTLVTKKEAE